MTTPILDSAKKRPSRDGALASMLFALIVIVALLAGVLALLAWAFAVALGIPFWPSVGLVVALIVIVAIGSRMGRGK